MMRLQAVHCFTAYCVSTNNNQLIHTRTIPPKPSIKRQSHETWAMKAYAADAQVLLHSHNAGLAWYYCCYPRVIYNRVA
eukprot:scaffold51287_cov63-Attheya_sp.AAC.1